MVYDHKIETKLSIGTSENESHCQGQQIHAVCMKHPHLTGSHPQMSHKYHEA